VWSKAIRESNINRHTEDLRKLPSQRFQCKEPCSFAHVNHEVNIAVWPVFTPRRATKDTDIARTMTLSAV
jgi:hypothetical protein